LRSSQILAFARLRSGAPGKLPLPVEDLSREISDHVLDQVSSALSVSATGSPETVRRKLGAIIEKYRPDELMVTGMIHDHSARIKSFETVSEILAGFVDADLEVTA